MEEYRNVLDDKFQSIHAFMELKFSHLEEKLNNHEKYLIEYNLKINNLEKENITHILNCPQTRKIEDINKSLEDYKFIVKYPKFSAMVFSGVILVFMLIGLSSFSIRATSILDKIDNMEKVHTDRINKISEESKEMESIIKEFKKERDNKK